MPKQVITVSIDGVISGLQVKPGKGFDLRKLGRARIERASEIIFDETAQRWFVHILKGYYAGLNLDVGLCTLVAFDRHELPADWVRSDADVILWSEYDDAVAGEILFLDHIRLKLGALALT